MSSHPSSERERAGAAAAAVAAAQRDLIRFDQALTCGLSRHAVRHLVTRGRWLHVLPRVYSTTTGEIRPERRRAAAVLSQRPLDGLVEAHPLVALFGVSALAQWGVDVSHPAVEVVHLVVPTERTPRAVPGLRFHRSSYLDALDVMMRDGLPVTRLERALVDAGSQIRAHSAYVALVADLVQNGRTTVERLQLELDLTGQVPGSPALRRVVAAVARGDRSVAECALADLIERSGVPAPQRGRVLATSIGGVIPDFLWPELGLYAEVDGREWHLNPQDWAHDVERQNALAQLGLTPLRYPARRVLRHGDQVVAEIRREVLRRAARRDSDDAA